MFGNRKARHRLADGFSLLELLAVITIMGILAAIVVPRLSGHALEGKTKVCYQYKGDLNSALERYFFYTGSWATDLSQIENNDNYYPDVTPSCPVDGSPYTIDPTTHRISGHSH